MNNGHVQPIELSFDPNASMDVVYRSISSLMDLALTDAGSSIAGLDAADLSLRELLSCFGSATHIDRVGLGVEAAGTVLTIGHHPNLGPVIDDASKAILDAGLPAVDLNESCVSVRIERCDRGTA